MKNYIVFISFLWFPTLILFGFLSQVHAAEAEPVESRPNIVLILSDDQAWNDYGFMGHEHIRTPHLDRLAGQSVVFANGYVTTPLCRPSLMSLVTGHHARTHGITGNDPSTRLAHRQSPEFVRLSRELYKKIDQIETLPKILVRNGYLAFQSGKWWEGHYRSGGFTHGMTQGDPGGWSRHGDAGLTIGREGMDPVYAFIELAQRENKPFFLWYAPFLPHTPHNPPERILRHYLDLNLDEALAKYYAMCEWFDETCGELIDHLDKKGLRENTLIYYVCDNGWIQRTADSLLPEGWNQPFAPGSKQSYREGGIRTPILFSWLDKLPPGTRSERITALDTFPTVLSAAGLEIPDGLPGWNLWENLIAGEKIDRDIIFGDIYAHDIADLDDPEASLLYLWCIEGDYKLILSYDGEVNRHAVVHPRDTAIQLFDLENDPSESTNLAPSHPQVVNRLKERIETWYPLRKRQLVGRINPLKEGAEASKSVSTN